MIMRSEQALPVFSFMDMQDVRELLQGAALQLVADGTEIARGGDLPHDGSLLHLVLAGKVQCELSLDCTLTPSHLHEDAQTTEHAEQGRSAGQWRSDWRSRGVACRLVREQGAGAHIGFGGMATSSRNRTSVRARGSCLLLTMQSGTVRKACTAGRERADVGWEGGGDGLETLKGACIEAARQELLLAALATNVLHHLHHLRSLLSTLVPRLVLLVGDKSFYRLLSGHVGATVAPLVPPRNVAMLFGCGREVLEQASRLHSLLSDLFQPLEHAHANQGQGDGNEEADGKKESRDRAGGEEAEVVSFKMQWLLPRVLELLASISRSRMEYAANALRSVAELTSLRAHPRIAAAIDAEEAACGCSLLHLLSAPLYLWPQEAVHVQEMVRDIRATLAALPAGSRNGDWLSKAIEVERLSEVEETARLVGHAQLEVAAYLDTLGQLGELAPLSSSFDQLVPLSTTPPPPRPISRAPKSGGHEACAVATHATDESASVVIDECASKTIPSASKTIPFIPIQPASIACKGMEWRGCMEAKACKGDSLHSSPTRPTRMESVGMDGRESVAAIAGLGRCYEAIAGLGVYTTPAAGLHHRVLMTIKGELLPSSVCVSDVCAGAFACRLIVLNDLLIVSLIDQQGDDGVATQEAALAPLATQGPPPSEGALVQRAAARGWKHPGTLLTSYTSSATIFYLPETVIMRIRFLSATLPTPFSSYIFALSLSSLPLPLLPSFFSS